jgi:protein phosphatase
LGHHLTVIGLSHIGRIRGRNEDSLSLAPDVGVAVLADGMGGHPGGDVASRIAADAASAHLRGYLPLDPGLDSDNVADSLSRAMAESAMRAHTAIRAAGTRDTDLEGMGTTLTALAVDAGTGAFAIVNVGDSRAYRFSDGKLVQLTRDDTWVQQRVDAADLTPEQARGHPFGHMLTQCIGLATPPDPHTVTGRVSTGDIFLLCTDGLTGMLLDEEISRILADVLQQEHGAGRGEVILQRLVAGANEAGGHDNVTVALVTVA